MNKKDLLMIQSKKRFEYKVVVIVTQINEINLKCFM